MEHAEISLPVHLRKRHAPIRFEVDRAEPESPKTEQDRYRQLYYEAIDLALSPVRERFDHPAFKVYASMETLLLKAAKEEENQQEIDYLKANYLEDLNIGVLTSQESLRS